MAQVRLEADLAHPPERVWRALTDARLLSEWFMVTDFTPRPGSRFTLALVHLTGMTGQLAAELLELREPERMVMRWQGENLHTTVVWELTGTESGCRITMVQSGFVGAPADLRRRALTAAYTQLFTERLPRLLDRLAPASERVSATAGVNLADVAAGEPRKRHDELAGSASAAKPVGVAKPAEPMGTAEPASASAGVAEREAAAAVPRQRQPRAATRDGVAVVAEGIAAGGVAAAGVAAAGVAAARPDSAGPKRDASGRDASGAVGSVRGRSGLGTSDDGAGPAPQADVASRPGAAQASEGATGSGATPATPRIGAAGRWTAGWSRWSRSRWLGWLSVVPAWGRAALIATAAAILAVVVLAGITQTWLPGFDNGDASDDRNGPGLAAQPGQDGGLPNPGAEQPEPDPAGDPEPGTASPAPGGPDVGAGQDPAAVPADAGTESLAADAGGTEGSGRSPGSDGDHAPQPPLTAVMSTSNRLLGLSGITVSVTITNPGASEVSEWEVSMDVGDQSVTQVTGADVERSGSRAYFTPAGDDIPAGGSLTFSFDIPGPLLGLGSAKEPVDCTIDDQPCG